MPKARRFPCTSDNAPEYRKSPPLKDDASELKGRHSSDALDSAVCLTIVLLIILAIWPSGEMGTMDDWSYAFMALKTSRAGHLTYNGWSAPMLGIQAFWGAAWIRLFG